MRHTIGLMQSHGWRPSAGGMPLLPIAGLLNGTASAPLPALTNVLVLVRQVHVAEEQVGQLRHRGAEASERAPSSMSAQAGTVAGRQSRDRAVTATVVPATWQQARAGGM